MNFLSITDALASNSETVSVLGHVLEVSGIETYKNKDHVERSFFSVKIADEHSFTSVRVYNKQLHKSITAQASYAFMNCLKKQDSATPFWAISTAQVVAWSPITVPASVMETAKSAAAFNSNSPRKLAEALTCETTSTVQGKVVQSSPVKYVRDGNLALKHVALKDEKSAPAVSLSLFGQDAERDYAAGDVISVTDVYKYKKSHSLSTKPSSTVEFHPSDLLPFDVDDKDVLDNPIFHAIQDDTVPFTIRGIKYAYIYSSCIKFSCKNKKLREGRCPNCGGSDASLYCNVRVVVEHNCNFSEHSLFFPELSRLLDLPPLSSFNDTHSLMDFIIRALPIQGRGAFNGDKMSVATVKRKHVD